MTAVIGTPASHARHLARERLKVVVAAAISASMLGFVALLLSSHAGTLVRVSIGFAAVAIFVLAWRARSSWVLYQRALAGVRSEDRVARALLDLDAEVVIHGALVAERVGDLDHLVLGPWAVAVETKTGRGKTAVRKGQLTVNGRWLPRDPCKQVTDQAAYASRRLGVPVDRVVCVVDTPSRPREIDGVWVCSLKDLPAVIRSLPARLSADQARQAGRQIPTSDSER